MVGLKKWSFTQMLTVVVTLCESAIIASANETAKSNTYGGENVNASLIQNPLTIKCGPGTKKVPFKNIQNVETVQMCNCPPPEESYADQLRTLNVNTSAIQKLIVNQITGDTLLKATHFKDLKIKNLSIESNYFRHQIAANDALELLTELTDVSLKRAQLLSKVSNVKNITVEGGSVSGDKFIGCDELRELNLFHTHPERVPSRWLENCTKLEILRVKSLAKPLSQDSLINVLEGATNLQELDLTNCRLRTLPWDLLTQAQQLRRLVLRNNYLHGIVLRNFKIKSLNYLDLKACHINSLKGLPVSNASQLDVDLSGNVMYDVQLEPDDHVTLEKNNVQITVKLTGSPIYVNCSDCKHGSLWRAVREKRLIIDARCNEGMKLGDAEHKARDRAECEIYNCVKASQCQCKKTWSSGAKQAHCDNAKMPTLPKEPGLQKLYAPGNDIHNIYAEDLLDSLQFLDLRNNSITLINASTVEKLFSVIQRHVLFYGNPIACVCENKVFLDALRTNQNRVDDYNSITCIGGEYDGKAISQFKPADVCPTKLPIQLGVTLAVLTITCMLIIFLYFRYNLTIKVFLYTKGWCLRCVREIELDADRPYDAFVSFSHGDANIVVEELVPKLEKPPSSFKMCVHYRDWIPGELISIQIKRSVAQSRRTIIVLSRNYINSDWGLMEFREAHINTLRDGQVRVIIIVLDDVLQDDNLDPELRAYLKANTYVQWGDPWFWDKLKYALPHKTTEENL